MCAFGHRYPNYDISALTRALCTTRDWKVVGVRFYTGIPDAGDRPSWSRFWSGKLAVMGREGVYVFTRPLRYRTRTTRLPDGSTHTFVAREEKGIIGCLGQVLILAEDEGDVVVAAVRHPDHIERDPHV
jgi:hypothetical protein